MTTADRGVAHDVADEAMEPTNAERGFTIVELMVVIAIISLFAAIAVPVIRGYRATRGRDLGNAALILRSTLRTARTYAIQYRVRTGVVFEPPTGPPDRYLIISENENPPPDEDPWMPPPGIVGKPHKVPDNVTIQLEQTQHGWLKGLTGYIFDKEAGTVNGYIFDPTGTLDTPSALKVTITLLDDDGEVSPRYIEILRATGQVRIR